MSNVLESWKWRRTKAEGNYQLRIFKECFQRVRGFSFIFQEETASHSRDASRCLQIECPYHDIHDVTPEVDESPARVIPELAKIIVRAQRMIRTSGRRAQPEIVIQFRGNGRRLICLDRLRWRSLPNMDSNDPPEFARLYKPHHAPVIVLVIVNVISHLADAFVFQRGVGHGASFGHAVTQRLFDEHV